MKFINKWSYALAKALANRLGDTHPKRGVYYYGFQIVIGAIVKGIIMTTVTAILGTFTQTLIVLVSFGALRVVAGGYHMSSYNKCIAVSIALFAAAGLIARYTYMYWPQEMIVLLIIFCFIGGLPILFKYAPQANPNRPITKKEEKKKLKYYSIVIFVILILTSSVFLFYNTEQIAIASLFGIILSLFIITPAGYKTFSKISGENKKI